MLKEDSLSSSEKSKKDVRSILVPGSVPEDEESILPPLGRFAPLL